VLAVSVLWLCVAVSTIVAAADKKPPYSWSQLTSDQQQILAPLANDWGTLDEGRRKKWLLLAKRYPKMRPDEQLRLQTQMKDWVELTPEQRRIARENYKKLAKQPPEKRQVVKQKWLEYKKQEQESSKSAPALSYPQLQNEKIAR
jgi:hypothetical protein